MPKMLTKGEAADRLNVSERSIERYIDADKLPAYRVGDKLVRLSETDVDAFKKKIRKADHDPE